MLNCWKTDPLERPSYKNVAYNLGCLLKRGTISVSRAVKLCIKI